MTGYFWQLSGSSGHIHYDWQTKTERIAEEVYDQFAIRDENGMQSLELILGVEESGATHILIPSNWYLPKWKKGGRNPLPSINWQHSRSEPYPSSRYASLSPMRIDSVLRLADLLEERQSVAKKTKITKQKTDNSKANGRFSEGEPNLTRAAFEHSRCLWRILHGKLNPEDYGLSPAPWSKSLVIFSLIFNFWQPRGDGGIEHDYLLDAAVAKLVLPSKENEDAESTTFHFKVDETLMLRNPFHNEHTNVPEIWQSRIVPKAEVCQEIQKIIDYESTIEGKLVTPVVILTYRYFPWLRSHLSSLGLRNSEWKEGISDLLGYVRSHRQYKEEDEGKTGSRSRSPIARSSTSMKSSRQVKREDSPQPTQAPAIYFIDVLESFRTASGQQPRPGIRPAEVYFKVTGQHPETGYAGHDTECILQIWKRLVEGPSFIDQNALFTGGAVSAIRDTSHPREETRNQVETAEAPGLFVQTTATQPTVKLTSGGVFDESDSDDEY